MMKYKVGDKVRIRKDLDVGMFYGRCRFVPEMRGLVGETVRITEVSKRDGYYRVDSNDKYWTDEMFEGKEKMNDNDSIRILVNGNQVVAIRMETGKKGVARCHPDDAFDFYSGAKLALERLKEAEKPYAWLEEGVTYYYPVPVVSSLYNSATYRADNWDKRVMERGMCMIFFVLTCITIVILASPVIFDDEDLPKKYLKKAVIIAAVCAGMAIIIPNKETMIDDCRKLYYVRQYSDDTGKYCGVYQADK
jgi:hypothetical protein